MVSLYLDQSMAYNKSKIGLVTDGSVASKRIGELLSDQLNLQEISKEVEINKKIGSGSNKSKQDIDGFLSKKSPTKKENLMNRLDDSNEKEQGSIIQRLEVTEAPKETDKLWEKLEKNREDKENIDRDIDR